MALRFVVLLDRFGHSLSFLQCQRCHARGHPPLPTHTSRHESGRRAPVQDKCAAAQGSFWKHTSEIKKNATTLIMKRGVHPVRKHNPLPPGNVSIHHTERRCTSCLTVFLHYYFIKDPECLFLEVVPLFLQALCSTTWFNAESSSS